MIDRAALIDLLQKEVDRIKALQNQLAIYDAIVGEHERYMGGESRAMLQNQIDKAMLDHESLLSSYFKLKSKNFQS